MKTNTNKSVKKPVLVQELAAVLITQSGKPAYRLANKLKKGGYRNLFMLLRANEAAVREVVGNDKHMMREIIYNLGRFDINREFAVLMRANPKDLGFGDLVVGFAQTMEDLRKATLIMSVVAPKLHQEVCLRVKRMGFAKEQIGKSPTMSEVMEIQKTPWAKLARRKHRRNRAK